MTPERWRQIDEIAQAALELNPAERRALVEERCAGDPELREQVLDLLAQCDGLGSFLEEPVEHARSALRVVAEGPPELPAAVRVGSRAGAYSVVGVIASGGMGVVYEAEQANPRRTVALKLIRPGMTRPELVRRFEYEAQILGQLHHPGIAQIYEAGTANFGDGPQPFLAMELIRGLPLTEYARQARLDVPARLELFARVCDAIEHAHQLGIIHRDLKPANILVEASGMPKVVDFGIARTLDAAGNDGNPPQTQAGQIVGTMAYMSPEQVTGGAGAVDTRADVYSLGVVLYELLAGHPPHRLDGLPLADAVRKVAEATPARLGAIDRRFRGDIETIVAKAIAPEPSRRYQSAGALGEDIRRHLRKEPVLARPPSPAYLMVRFAQRHRVLVSAAIAVLLALMIGLAATYTQYLRLVEAQLKLQGAFQAETGARQLAQRAAQSADELRTEADRARAVAEREAASQRAMNLFFLSGVLESTFPWRSGPSVRVIEAIDQNVQRIGSTFAGNPLTEARVHHYIGNIYQELGRFEDAEIQLRAASALWRRELGAAHDETITTESWLAKLLRRMGRLEEAENLARDVLDRTRVTLAATPYRTAAHAAELAKVLRLQGRTAEAETLLREAVDINSRTLGPVDAGVLRHARELVDLLIVDGRADEAAAVLECQLSLAQEPGAPPSSDQDRFNIETELAGVHLRAGRSAEAATVLERAASRLSGARGEHDEIALSAWVALADVLWMHRPEAAEQAAAILRRVLEQRAQNGVGVSPGAIADRARLACSLMEAGLEHEAEAEAREAYRLEDAYLRENRFLISATLWPLADILRRRGKLEEAERYAEMNFVRSHTVRGPRRTEGMLAAQVLAEVRLDGGRPALAETPLREALTRAIPESWQERHHLARLRILLAVVLGAQGNFAEGDELLREGVVELTRGGCSVSGPDRRLLERAREFLRARAAASAGATASMTEVERELERVLGRPAAAREAPGR